MRNAQTESLHITNMAFIPQTLHGTAIYYAYIGVGLGVNVGTYGIHGVFGSAYTSGAIRVPLWPAATGNHPALRTTPCAGRRALLRGAPGLLLEQRRGSGGARVDRF